MNADISCKADSSHTTFDLNKKQCKQCEARLQKKCFKCLKTYGYSNFASHSCQPVISDDQHSEKRIRLAIVKDVGFGKGQYAGSLAGFHNGFPRHRCTFVTGETEEMASYDAIFGGSLVAKDFEIVCILDCVQDVVTMRAEKAADLFSGVDVLIMGDWANQRAAEVASVAGVFELFHHLQDLELQHGLRVFPPLEYVWYFSRKAYYYNRLSLMQGSLPPHACVIPTMAVPKRGPWKAEVREFVRSNLAVLKREFSGRSEHVLKVDCADDSSQLAALLNSREAFQWMAQPVIEEFAVDYEFRMYVINGKCTWGTATRAPDLSGGAGFVVEREPVAPGRPLWETGGGADAARVAERVVSCIKNDMGHAAKFLRVDMVRRRPQEQHGRSAKRIRQADAWWINELEYFGNTFIFFDAFDTPHVLLQEIGTCVVEWMRELITPRI